MRRKLITFILTIIACCIYARSCLAETAPTCQINDAEPSIQRLIDKSIAPFAQNNFVQRAIEMALKSGEIKLIQTAAQLVGCLLGKVTVPRR